MIEDERKPQFKIQHYHAPAAEDCCRCLRRTWLREYWLDNSEEFCTTPRATKRYSFGDGPELTNSFWSFVDDQDDFKTYFATSRTVLIPFTQLWGESTGVGMLAQSEKWGISRPNPLRARPQICPTDHPRTTATSSTTTNAFPAHGIHVPYTLTCELRFLRPNPRRGVSAIVLPAVKLPIQITLEAELWQKDDKGERRGCKGGEKGGTISVLLTRLASPSFCQHDFVTCVRLEIKI